MNDFKIVSLTLNLGENSFKDKTKDQKMEIFNHFLDPVIFPKQSLPDIISIHFQESPPKDPIYFYAKQNISKQKDNNQTVYDIYEVNNASKIGPINLKFYQRLLVAVKRTTNFKLDKTAKTCLGKFPCNCCKGSVGISIIGNNSKNEQIKLVFVNSHLPVKPKSDNLGLEIRNKAFNQTVDDIIDKLIVSGDNYNVIWGGDFNYRMLPVHDQLSEQISLMLIGDYHSFKEGKNNCGNYLTDPLNYLKCINFNPTCKFDLKSETNERNYITCRKCKSKKSCPKDCYNDKRKPSFCDRILYEGKELVNNLYDSFYYEFSDHNGVVAHFTLKLN